MDRERHTRAATTAALFSAVVMLALCAGTWSGGFLGDDVSLVHHAHRVIGEQRTLAYLFGAFTQAEGLQNGFYRPTGLASWIVSALHAGYEPAGWRVGNALLHLLNGWLVLRLVRRIVGVDRTPPVAWFAAAAFWLYPLAPEASVWIAARFDQLALAGMLVACERHLARHRVFDGAHLASLLALTFALTSKEPAILTPGLMLVVSLVAMPAPAMPGWRPWIGPVLREVRDVLPALAMLVAYFVLRRHLFGHAVQVYEVHAPLQVFDFGIVTQRLAGFAPVLVQPFGTWAGVLVATVLGVLATGAMVARQAGCFVRAWLLPLAAAVGSAAAIVVHFTGVETTGFGARLFYVTGAWLAIALFLPFAYATRHRALHACATILLPVFAIHLAVATQPWREAGLAMRDLLPRLVAKAGTLHARGEFGLVLAADTLHTATFARNAQGGMGQGGVVPVHPHAGSIMVTTPFEPVVVEHFERLGGITLAGERTLRTYCVDALPWNGEVRLVPITLSTPLDQPAAWWREWTAAVTASACADDFPDLR